MAKYVIEIPDEVKWIQYIQQTRNGTQNLKVESVSDLTHYTESDEREIRKRIINEVCNKFLENNYYYGDDIKQVLWRMKDGEVVGMAEFSKLDEIRHKVEQEVWEFATMLMRMHPDVAEDIYWSMNGGKGIGVAAEMTYQEAKTAYNAWKNRNICVGDEVIYDSRTKAVVLIPETKERYGTILTDDFATIVVSHDELEKTGIHFDDIAELLKKMREE